MHSNRDERGGIVSFVVVGVLLAGLLVGGIYLVKRQGEAARADSAAQETAQIKENAEKAAKEAEETAKSEAEKDSTVANSGATGQPKGGDGSTTGTGSSRVATTGPSDVPSTGPEDTLAIVVVMAAGVAGFWYYTESRRTLVRSALK